MTKIIFLFISLLFMLSCTQQEEVLVGNEQATNSQPTATVDAQIAFAKLLSEAASNSKEVRTFLRDEALAQFNNDYDVFYPYAKSKIVSGNQTFRDVLLSYCNSENDLIEIEQALPLLNILVPDLSLFWDFNATTWDINNKEIAILCRDDESNSLYENGEHIGNLTKGEIPGFPCLVIKNNERLRLSSCGTRTEGATYEFVSEAYNGKKGPQTRHSSYDKEAEPTDDSEAYVSAADLHPSVIKAWEEFKDVNKAFQRDGVYYNIDKTNQPGKLNRNMRESLYKFRIFPSWLWPIADQAGSDPQLNKEFTVESADLTNKQLLQIMWTDGKFEFDFDLSLGADRQGALRTQRITFSLAASELWSIEKVHIEHINKTLFRGEKNTYTIHPDNLKPRWIYPSKLISDNSVFFHPWDLSMYSTWLYLSVTEYDAGENYKESRTYHNQYFSEMDASSEARGVMDGSIKQDIKMGYGFSGATLNSTKIEMNRTMSTDKLGDAKLSYEDPIIVDDSQKSTKGYKIFTQKSGNAFEVMFLPKSIY